MGVEVQFENLGALVYYISPPVDQNVCAKETFFHRENTWKMGVWGITPRRIVDVMSSRTSESAFCGMEFSCLHK